VSERDVRRDQRDSQGAAGQKHRKVLHAGAGGEEFGLPGKREPHGLGAGFVNRTGDYGVDLAGEHEACARLQSVYGCLRGERRGRSSLRVAALANDPVCERGIEFSAGQRRANNLRADARCVSKRNADGSRTASRAQLSKS